MARLKGGANSAQVAAETAVAMACGALLSVRTSQPYRRQGGCNYGVQEMECCLNASAASDRSPTRSIPIKPSGELEYSPATFFSQQTSLLLMITGSSRLIISPAEPSSLIYPILMRRPISVQYSSDTEATGADWTQ